MPGGPARTGLSPALLRLLIGAGIVLIVAIGLYWAGLARGRAQMAQQKSDDASQIKTARDQAQAAQSQAATLQTQNRVMASRGLLYLAAVALDRRNFGTANDDIQKAQQVLAALPAGVPGIDTARLDALRRTLAATKIEVATDTGAAHTQIITLAAQADALITPPD
jgi:hypothetical protein